jgi:hypothetical protein
MSAGECCTARFLPVYVRFGWDRCGSWQELGSELSVEKFCERAILDRLEFAHVDVVLADEWLDLTRTPACVLLGGIELVEQRL